MRYNQGHRDCVPDVILKRVEAPRRLASHNLGRTVAFAVSGAHGKFGGHSAEFELVSWIVVYVRINAGAPRLCSARGFKGRSGATQAASHWLGRAVALAVREAHGRWCELEGGGDWVPLF